MTEKLAAPDKEHFQIIALAVLCSHNLVNKKSNGKAFCRFNLNLLRIELLKISGHHFSPRDWIQSRVILHSLTVQTDPLPIANKPDDPLASRNEGSGCGIS